MSDKPPPVVTISDPTSPAPPSDVIGGGVEREPRRLSRRGKVVALAVLLVVAVITVPVLVVVDRREQARLDRLAGEQVDLAVPEDLDGIYYGTESNQQFAALTLENRGSSTVEILTARVDREGYPTQQVQLRIDAGAAEQVNVALPQPCPQEISLYSHPRRILLTIRTHRGPVVDRTVRLSDSFGEDYQRNLRLVCGVLDPSEALSAKVRVLEEAPRHLLVNLSVQNRAKSAFTVQSFSSLGAFDLTSDDLPLTVPANGAALAVVRLEIRECRNARAMTRVEPHSSLLQPFLLMDTAGGGVATVFDADDAATALSGLVDRVC